MQRDQLVWRDYDHGGESESFGGANGAAVSDGDAAREQSGFHGRLEESAR